jgi:hypothetical protein
MPVRGERSHLPAGLPGMWHTGGSTMAHLGGGKASLAAASAPTSAPAQLNSTQPAPYRTSPRRVCQAARYARLPVDPRVRQYIQQLAEQRTPYRLLSMLVHAPQGS